MRQFRALFIISSVFFQISVPSQAGVQSSSEADTAILKRVDKKYQDQHGIHMNLKKTITMGLLGTTKNSEGEVWLHKGQMRLEIQKPEPSKVVAAKEYLWIESSPPKGFDDAKVQVMKASMTSKQAKSQGLVQLLTQGGVLKYFKVSGVQKEGDKIVYFLQPDKQSVEFKRAQIKVNKKDMNIVGLRYWDQMDNETNYEFSNIEFNQSFPAKTFDYQPPKNAEVIVY